MDLKKTFTVSNKSFIILILSGILLYISTKIVIENQSWFVGYLCKQSGSDNNYITYTHFFDASFLIGFVALCFTALFYSSILIMKPGEKQYEKNRKTEAFANAVSGFNLGYSIISLFIIVFKYYIPLSVFLFLIIGISASVLFLTYKYSPSSADNNVNRAFLLWEKINSALMKHSFKNFQLIFVLAILFPFYTFPFSLLVWGKVFPLLQIFGAVIAFSGVVYFMAARIIKYRKMDEFQKRLMLEHSFVFFNIFIFLLFCMMVLYMNFRIEIEFTNFAYPTFLLVAISSVIVENKYK